MKRFRDWVYIANTVNLRFIARNWFQNWYFIVITNICIYINKFFFFFLIFVWHWAAALTYQHKWIHDIYILVLSTHTSWDRYTPQYHSNENWDSYSRTFDRLYYFYLLTKYCSFFIILMMVYILRVGRSFGKNLEFIGNPFDEPIWFK